MGGKTLKELDNSLSGSFSRIKDDIFDLKKARNSLSKEVNDLNLKQIELERDMANSESLHKMQLKVENIAYEQKSVKDFSDIVAVLKKDSVMKGEFQRSSKKLESDVRDLKNEIKKLKKSKDVVKESRIKELEKSLLTVDDVKKVFMEDIRRKYLDADEVSSEINPLKKEFFDLYNIVNKIKKEVLNFQRARFFSNICLVIALVSFIGAALALGFNYIYAANFLGIETLVFLIIAFVIKLGVAVRK